MDKVFTTKRMLHFEWRERTILDESWFSLARNDLERTLGYANSPYLE